MMKNFFDRQRAKSSLWLKAYIFVLAILVIANFFMYSDDPHFTYDAYPLFWPAFGVFVGLVMILFVKKIVQPFIFRDEEYYNDL